MQAASTIKLYDMDTNMLNKENRDEIIKIFFIENKYVTESLKMGWDNIMVCTCV